jgi:hypothetical protein
LNAVADLVSSLHVDISQRVACPECSTERKKYNMKEGVNYTFGTPVKLVQGKKYENDAQKNRLIYEEFQYIKIKVQG